MLQLAAEGAAAVDAAEQALGFFALQRPAQLAPVQLEIARRLAQAEAPAGLDLARAFDAQRGDVDVVAGHARLAAERERTGGLQLGVEAADVERIANPAAGQAGGGYAERLRRISSRRGGLVQRKVLKAEGVDHQVQRQAAGQAGFTGGWLRGGRRQPDIEALHFGHLQMQAVRQQLARHQPQVHALEVDAGAVSSGIVQIVDDELAEQPSLRAAELEHAAAEALRQSRHFDQAALAVQRQPDSTRKQQHHHQQHCRAPQQQAAHHRPTLTPRCRRTASAPVSKGCARSMATAPNGRR